jgi:hypothetical protein
MGSIMSVAMLDTELRKRSGGALGGLWKKPTFPRTFRVANGQTIKATFEVEFKIPLAKIPGNEYLIINVAAVDTGKDGASQVPWLFSNESGYLLGAVASSRTGKVVMEEPRLEGWEVTMVHGKSGHWLFPVVEAFVELATPPGAKQPISQHAYVTNGSDVVAVQDPENVFIVGESESEDQQVSHEGKC